MDPPPYPCQPRLASRFREERRVSGVYAIDATPLSGVRLRLGQFADARCASHSQRRAERPVPSQGPAVESMRDGRPDQDPGPAHPQR